MQNDMTGKKTENSPLQAQSAVADPPAAQSARPLRVLWLSEACSLQDDPDNPGLSGRMESIITGFLGERITLAAAYMNDGRHEPCFTQNGITYYAVDADMRVGLSDQDWEKTRAELLRIIDDFHPDIIQCFGSEWPYGRIAEDTDIPVVIHMMGFLNIYYMAIHMAQGTWAPPAGWKQRIKKLLHSLIRRPGPQSPPQDDPEERWQRRERRIMSANRFFFGRTEWDRNIVRCYSPGARYFHVPEMIKPQIYDAAGKWRWHGREKIRIFTLSSADDRKGNEIILRAAEVLKEVAGLKFEWRVAGGTDSFLRFEQKTGIRREDVHIELTGRIGCGQIIEEMAEADFFVHPSIIDNSPHSICEAQLIGCSVISSNVGGVPDLVTDGETGFLYPYNEPHTLAFLIAGLCKEKERLTAVSEKALRTAKERHDPRDVAECMYQAYMEIISSRQA